MFSGISTTKRKNKKNDACWRRQQFIDNTIIIMKKYCEINTVFKTVVMELVP